MTRSAQEYSAAREPFAVVRTVVTGTHAVVAKNTNRRAKALTFVSSSLTAMARDEGDLIEGQSP
jgi:hypothetical protein